MLEEIVKNYKKQIMKLSISRTGTSIMVVLFTVFMIIMIE